MALFMFTVASLTATAAFFALQRRIRSFRYSLLEREMVARWSRLDATSKIEVLRRLGDAPMASERPEQELDVVFRELLAKAWRRMRRQKAFDLEWLAYRLTAAGV
jgi:hypothetical protein